MKAILTDLKKEVAKEREARLREEARLAEAALLEAVEAEMVRRQKAQQVASDLASQQALLRMMRHLEALQRLEEEEGIRPRQDDNPSIEAPAPAAPAPAAPARPLVATLVGPPAPNPE
jgi:hypothetical protein